VYLYVLTANIFTYIILQKYLGAR